MEGPAVEAPAAQAVFGSETVRIPRHFDEAIEARGQLHAERLMPTRVDSTGGAGVPLQLAPWP